MHFWKVPNDPEVGIPSFVEKEFIHPHFHVVVLDGVFERDNDRGTAVFHPSPVSLSSPSFFDRSRTHVLSSGFDPDRHSRVRAHLSHPGPWKPPGGMSNFLSWLAES